MLRTVLLAALLPLGCQTQTPVATVTAEHDHHPAEPASVHGMLMVGDGPIYLSHLPMFHAPHDYQVILEVTLLKEGADPTATYTQDRAVTGERLYTVVPEPFVLTEIFAPPGTPARTSFRARLVRGHFERGGQTFMSGVTIKVTRVIMAKKLESNAPALANLKYVVFGDSSQLFAAHLIQRMPDFDHVVAARIDSGVLDESLAQELRAGSIVSFPGITNDVAHALGQESAVTGEATLGGQTHELGLQVGSEFYLETGDLSF